MNDSVNDQEQPLISHLVELRQRLMRSVLAVFYPFLGFILFRKRPLSVSICSLDGIAA